MAAQTGLILLAVAVLSAALAALVAWAGPVDAPDDRRNHASPTPTSGGLAIMAAFGAGLALLACAHTVGGDPRLGRLALLAAAAGLLGAADDVLDFGPATKLWSQAALAVAFAACVARIDALPLAPGLTLPLGPMFGAAGVTLWMVTLTNAVNFMDGADGLAAGSTLIAFLGLATAAGLHGQPALATASLVAAAATLGFLPWNFPRHRLFQGDAGALFSGFLLAGLAVLAAAPAQGRALSPYPVVFAALPMLTDVLLTLLVRARARKPLGEAHREHVYQRWLAAGGGGHPALTWRFWLITGVFTAVGVAAEQLPPGWAPVIFAASVAAASLGWFTLRRRLTPDG